MRAASMLAALTVAATLIAATSAMAQSVEVVALDECDPTTFNTALGAGFCANVAAGGYATDFSTLLNEAENGTPSPDWDFEPDKVVIKKGTTLVVVNQGGETHTFTEVKKFGDGFVAPLNPGGANDPVLGCSGGFGNLKVAKTRIVSGSELIITGLSEGKHYFQCCIHPWMRMEVDVK